MTASNVKKKIKGADVGKEARVWTAEQAAAHNIAQQNLRYGNQQFSGLYGQQNWKYDQYGNPVVEQTRTPEQQRLYETDVALSQMGREYAQGALQSFASRGPFDAQLSDRPLPAQLDEARSRMEGEAYTRLTRDLDQQQALELDQLQQQLANQGIDQSNPLYRRELDDFHKRYQRARDEARQNAVAIGGQELERTFGVGETRRANELREQLTQRGQQVQELGAFSQFGTGAREQQFQPFQGSQYAPRTPLEILMAKEGQRQAKEGESIARGQLGLQQQALAASQRGGGAPAEDSWVE